MSDAVPAGPARIWTVSAGAPFLDVLAVGLIDGTLWPAGARPGALGLADATIYLPTRRAGRALAVAIQHAAAAGVFIPRIAGLGEVGEDEGAFSASPDGDLAAAETVSEAERRMVLADIAMEWSATTTLWTDRPPVIGPQPVPRTPAEATAFAIELARFFDEMTSAGASGERLNQVVPADLDDLARNWAVNLEFLTHAIDRWSGHLRARGLVDRVARRDLHLRGEAQRLAREGSPQPIIAAGSTGSVPAAAALLRAIAGLANGAVILPGLDMTLDERGWRAIGPDHPQFGMKQLLETIGVDRGEVLVLGPPLDPPAQLRARLAGEIMRPAAAADLWVDAIAGFDRGQLRASLSATSLIEADDEHEEARVIALMLRRAVDEPGRLTALVTPDRTLARRVAGELARWRIEIDDSAGQPLATCEQGVLLRLIAEVAASRFAPVATLSLFKHPLVRLGLTAAGARHAARVIEIAALRGTRPGPGLGGISSALAATEASESRHPVASRLTDSDFAEARELLHRLEQAMAPFSGLHDRGGAVAAGAFLKAHVEAAEALSRMPEGEVPSLWLGPAGEAAASFLAEALAAVPQAKPVRGSDYAGWLDQLMRGRVVRAVAGGPANIVIWGPLEARLQHVDRLILGGLNEGVWPAETETDPWLGRNMRAALGLDPPERRIGLQAHDVAQALPAGDVIFTRARKSGGTPAVPSRWLWRMRMLLRALGCAEALEPFDPWIAWSRGLDAAGEARPCPPPRPAPPVAARPRRLSVTRIETLIRDPYAIYASEVLRLRPLDALDLAPDAADYGQLIHAALGRLLAEHPSAPLPENALVRLVEIGDGELDALADRPGLRAYWRLRFLRIARWFVARDHEARAPGILSRTEITGRMPVPVPGSEAFTLTGRADRIDLAGDGSATIVDYKTGRPPTGKQIKQLLSPQLPLEAAMLRHGAFEDIGATPIAGLVHVALTGREPPGESVPAPGDAEELAAEALLRLTGLLAAYANPAHPYLSRIAPFRTDIEGDFDHLARVGEWSLAIGRSHAG